MTINASDFKSALDNADTLRARNASLRADVSQLEQRIGQMRKTIDRLKAVGARLVRERETAKAMADEARTGVDNLRGQLELADASNASLSAWNAELDGAARNAAVALASIIEKAEAMLALNTRLRDEVEQANAAKHDIWLGAVQAQEDAKAQRALNTPLKEALATARKDASEWKDRALGHARALRVTEDRLAAFDGALRAIAERDANGAWCRDVATAALRSPASDNGTFRNLEVRPGATCLDCLGRGLRADGNGGANKCQRCNGRGVEGRGEVSP